MIELSAKRHPCKGDLITLMVSTSTFRGHSIWLAWLESWVVLMMILKRTLMWLRKLWLEKEYSRKLGLLEASARRQMYNTNLSSFTVSISREKPGTQSISSSTEINLKCSQKCSQTNATKVCYETILLPSLSKVFKRNSTSSVEHATVIWLASYEIWVTSLVSGLRRFKNETVSAIELVIHT